MIVCADDFGLSDDVNQAALELIRNGRLSAVSCMVGLEQCNPKSLSELLEHQSEVDIGLHLCLTDEGLPLEMGQTGAVLPPLLPSFHVLLRKAVLGQVRPQDISRQVSNQYALFVQKCGRRPDFIDGHLHTHQFPGAWSGVLDFVLSLPSDNRPYIRNTRVSPWKLWQQRLPWLKAFLIGVFGAQCYSSLRRRGLSTNDGFAGIYDFHRGSKYHDYLPKFIKSIPHPNSILVVHPGHREEWRQREFMVLSNFNFASGALTRFQRELCN